MQQLVFLTVFLGLVAGTQPVALSVPSEATSVELKLDGATVAQLTKPPWRANVDFGEALLPHRLEAVARDANGEVLGTVAQKVNAAAEPRELQLVLEGQKARIVWSHLDAAKPQEVRATVDGKRVEVAPDLTVALPETAGDGRVHVLHVSVRTEWFQRDAQLMFGAIFEGTSSAALTAVPVRVRGKPARLGDIACSAGGREVRAVALENLPAQVIVIRDPSPAGAASRLKAFARSRESSGTVQSTSQRHFGGSYGKVMQGSEGTSFDTAFALGPSDEIRFLWPVGREGKGELRSLLFPPSPWYSAADRFDLRELLTTVAVRLPEKPPQYADAVAVAALQAAQSQRPRAVVLVLDPEAKDGSRLTPAAARAYADRLGVPLLVWSLGPTAPTGWAAAARIDTAAGLRKAVYALRQELEAQRVLWVEGDFLAHEVAVVGDGIETLVR